MSTPRTVPVHRLPLPGDLDDDPEHLRAFARDAVMAEMALQGHVTPAVRIVTHSDLLVCPLDEAGGADAHASRDKTARGGLVSLARSVAGRVRRGLVRRANDVLDRIEAWAGEPSSRRPEPTGRVSPFASGPAPVPTRPTPAPEPVAAPTPSGPQLTYDQVQALFEDMVRPALQSDGGDITLLRVENNDVFVQLVGACSTCSSSVVPMRTGIERLLREEFPHFGELHEVPGPA